jgi:hypothetical protein
MTGAERQRRRRSKLASKPAPEPKSTSDFVVWSGWPPQVWDGKRWKYIPEAKLLCELQRRLDDIGAPLWRTPEQVEADFVRAAKLRLQEAQRRPQGAKKRLGRRSTGR